MSLFTNTDTQRDPHRARRIAAAITAFSTALLLPACTTTQQNTDDQPAHQTSAAPKIAFEKADDPIDKLASPGPHCFETAPEADTARRRAADNINEINAAQQKRLDDTGAVMDVGRPFTVTDIRPNAQGGGTCYLVRMHTIQAQLNEDLPLSGCCA